MHRFLLRFLILVLGSAMLARAQTATGRLAGRVIDPGGAVIPGAGLTLVNEETGVKSSARSGADGGFIVALLEPGPYRLAAAMSGFKRYERRVVIATGETAELEIRLELGGVAETVTVSEAAPLLEASSSDIGQLIENKTVQEMPLNGRRALALAQLAGATVWVSYGGEAKPNFSLAGGRTQSQMFWIDGGSGQNMRLGIGQVDIDPPVEVIREFRILSNNYAAEFGGSAGGVIVATTRSGTNAFHGSAWEYFRNDKLDAANFFAPVDSAGRKQKAPLRYNLFGGALGGPVLRNRAHFFAAFEGTRKSTGLADVLTVPSAEQRAGDFSQTLDARGALIRIYDPETTRMEGGRMVRDPFAGNRIPAERIDPVAAKLLPFWPAPNRPADNRAGANNFAGNYASIFHRDNVTARIDHVFTQANRFYFRYLFNRDPLTNTSVYPDPGADTRTSNSRHQQVFLWSDLHSFTPNLMNDLRVSYSTRTFHDFSAGLGGDWPARLGLRGVPSGAFPRVTVAGIASLGASTHERLQMPIRQQQVVDNLTWIRGNHQVKFGGEMRRSRNLDILRTSISGAFGFTTQPTGLPASSATGLGLASLLLGFPNTFSVRETDPLDRHSYYLAGFFQDDWKVLPALTLNLGIRWETDTPMVDVNRRLNGFDAAAINPVSSTPGVVRFAGREGWPEAISEGDWNNFGPRFGFAWKPFRSGKSVVRGGFGVFFAHPFDHGAPNSAALGFERSASLSSPDQGITPPFLLRNGVPPVQVGGQALDAAFGAVPLGRNPTTQVNFYERNRRAGYSQQFNFGVQHELPGHILLETAYIGNLSRKLANRNMSSNQIRPEVLVLAAAANRPGTQRDRPFPQFNDVLIQFPTLGVTNYNAGVLKVERRFAGGFNLFSTYTWSKNIGDADSGGAEFADTALAIYSDFYNRRLNRGPVALDINHRFTFSSVCELPLGKGRRWLQRGPAARALGGWSMGTIAQLQSGPPFLVTTQTNTSNAFSSGAQRADVVRDPNLPAAQRKVERWFDTDAFRAPAPYTFGNSGPGLVRADGRIDFDFSLLRNFAFGEGRYVQLRTELFNAFNHTNFDLPGRTLGGPGFGIVNSAGEGRIIQFGLRVVF